MPINLTQKLFYVCKTFAKASIKHYIRTVLIFIFIIIYNIFQINLVSLTMNSSFAQIFAAVSFLLMIESSIKSILTFPIRNTAITLARLDYLSSTLKAENLYDRFHSGEVQSRFRRLEYLFTSFDREIITIVLTLGPVIICTYKLLVEYALISILYLILILLVAYFAINRAVRLRRIAFQADESMNQEIFQLLLNKERNISLADLSNAIEKDRSAYTKAILTKFYFKIIIITLNIIYLAIIYYMYTNIEYNAIKSQFSIVIINFIKLIIALMTFMGLLDGFVLEVKEKRKKSKSGAIQEGNISINNLSIIRVFNNISLSIPFGAKYTLLGPNGSGKTLLCRIIAGLEPKIYKSNSDVVLMLNINQTIVQSEIEQLKVNKEWEYHFSDLYNNLLFKPHLSKGEMVLLLIATVFLNKNIEVLLLDELLDILDDTILADVLNMLKKLRLTVIIVTHRQEIIDQFNAKIILQDQQIYLS